MGTLLVSTDGSDLAIEAARAGLAVAAPAERVVIVTVIDDVDPSLAYDGSGMAGPTMSVEEVEDLQRRVAVEGDEAIAHTATALADVLEGTEVETRVLAGHPAHVLCELADELDAAAIVMGSRGRGGIKRAILGSVSDHVVRNAECPVIISGPHLDD